MDGWWLSLVAIVDGREIGLWVVGIGTMLSVGGMASLPDLSVGSQDFG
jgi:hypothetical protein